MATKGILARDLPCTLLSIDPGATSGWALWSSRLCASDVPPGAITREQDGVTWWWETGIADDWRSRRGIVLDAVQRALDRSRPLVVVAETWPGLRGTALAGLGAQWGRWLAELERLDLPARRIVRLTTGDWRRVVLGGVRCRSTEAWKAASRARAHAVLGHDPGPDAADALCIGLAGLRSPSVANAIGKRELKRLGWEER
jgi:hypothetical protein